MSDPAIRAALREAAIECCTDPECGGRIARQGCDSCFAVAAAAVAAFSRALQIESIRWPRMMSVGSSTGEWLAEQVEAAAREAGE